VKYNLGMVNQSEFENLNHLTLACFDQGRQVYRPRLTQISTEISEMPDIHQPMLAKGGALALTMSTWGTRHETFEIWVTDRFKPGSYNLYQTLVHELVHGYAGLALGHNINWRRWFYRVLWHADEAGMLPPHGDDLRAICFSIACRYSQKEAWRELGLIDQTFEQAQKEHTKVMNDYLRRAL
jgi:hypothetical protein